MQAKSLQWPDPSNIGTSLDHRLDGSLPGDRGFDPLGLSRPNDFVLVRND
jgi:hypothetical protein